jgi:hypothetical protein
MGWYHVEQRDSWAGIQDLIEQRFVHPDIRWVFRGQRSAVWDLKPSLERIAIDRFKRPYDHQAYIEWRLFRHFGRHVHRFVRRVPRRDDLMEWYALMQHHGAPTRLMDWTYSFHIALFFAIEQANPGDTCAVWAIDQQWMFDTLKRSRNAAVQRAIRIDPRLKSPEAIRVLVEKEPSIVVPLVPYYINERLAVQQGVFLVSMNLNRPFMDNLSALATPKKLHERVLKIEIPVTEHNQWYILAWLNRLNVNRLSLFPGIDGFATSLQSMVAWQSDPSRGWRKRRATQDRSART